MEINVKRINELIKMPHVYLDLDGVQADFFGAWARIHNVPTYKHIADPEAAINELAASGPEKVRHFFSTLDPLPGGLQIIRWLNENTVPFTVLSAPLRGEPHASIAGKKEWLDRHNPGTSNYAIFTSKKHDYALKSGYPQVLVDDFGKYLTAWDEAGGIAIKHDEVTTAQTIVMLEKIYSRK